LKIRLIFKFPIANCETHFGNFFAGSALGFRGGETKGRSNSFKRSRCLAVGLLTSTFKRDTFSDWSKQPLQNIGQPRRLVSQRAFITSVLVAAGGENFGFPLHSSGSTEQPQRLVFQNAFIASALAAAGKENFGFPLHSSDSTEQPRQLVFQRAYITSALAAAGKENFGFPSHSSYSIEP
jgi:hypothetical protein